jgi:hypothetical protein
VLRDATLNPTLISTVQQARSILARKTDGCKREAALVLRLRHISSLCSLTRKEEAGFQLDYHEHGPEAEVMAKFSGPTAFATNDKVAPKGRQS